MESSTLVFFVNGKKIVDDKVDPEWTLLYYLRNKLLLCGTKLGCAEGGCGACTVMISKYNEKTKQVVHLSANACLAPVCSMHGVSVTTVEGIGSTKTRLHPVQERIAKAHGSQCGFCTPGIVMSMYALLRSNPKPSFKDMEVAFQGNLCRCTGYRPIIAGYRTFTEDWEVGRSNGESNGECGMGDKCCKNLPKANGNATPEEENLFNKSEFVPLDPSQEPIFPPELKISETKLDTEYLVIKGERATWYRPTTLEQILDLKLKFPEARIVAGNSEVGVEVKFKNCFYPTLIQPMQVPEMTAIDVIDQGLKIGASATLNEIQIACEAQISSQPEYKTRIFLAVSKMLHWFAGRQIRNVSAVGGNIMTGSPISDLNPIFMAAGCKLELVSKARGIRTVVMDHTFFTGYRTNLAAKDEILLSILLPYTEERQYFHAYKQAKRRDDDIAIVNAAFNVKLASKSDKIEDISLAFGGMSITTVLARRTKSILIGKSWNEEMLEVAYKSLIDDLPLDPSAPGGMIQYRRSLTLSLFFKAYLAISKQINKTLPARCDGAEAGLDIEIPRSSQYFQVAGLSGKLDTDTVGRPVVHRSAFKQATGEAVYCDDMPQFPNELYLAPVLSTRAHAKILSVDASEALALPGVTAFFSAKDLDLHSNQCGPLVHDELVFATDEVYCQGQVIAAIVADNQILAQRASRLVVVKYEDILPTIVTIEDAIAANSYLPGMPKCISRGDVDQAFATADHTLSGEVRLGGQEHFYLETQCCIAVPKGEDEEIELFSSTQHPTEIQKLVSSLLNIPMSKVVCRVKRMGGGFGGKESRSAVVALPVAFAAQRLGRPVRCMLDRDQDMMMTGQRHPFKTKYEVAFTKEGKLVGCKMDMYSNSGFSVDLSPAVMERALLHFENSYLIPHARVRGWCCRTNLPTNTAFRGFGGPQAMFVAETMIRDVADFLRKDPLEISALNLYKEGDSTHFRQELTYCTLTRCWDECLQRADYANKLAGVREFNRQNRWKKRGLSVVPTKFGIAFTVLFLNQSGALVHVYTDGSVLLTHGGTEMGQGLHTKMIQVASKVLDIPDSYIHLSETSTDKVPNTPATAASAGSDLNGMAVMIACQKIADRIAPYKSANPDGKWEDWVNTAFLDRTSLSATGFYKTPGIGYQWETNTGTAFNYFTYGAACSEVEIDCLTGDHRVLSTNIVMDLGESLNPAIDIGQVEGGFLQGYGLFTMEEPVVSPTGVLYSRGPGAYKIPGFGDIPLEFNVSLLKGAPNPRAVYSSKAVGEPPLFLAASVFFAIKDAIASARQEVGLKENFRFDSPATAANIRLACADDITAKFPEAKPGSFKPWNVSP